MAVARVLKLYSFATVIPDASPYCLALCTNGCEVGRPDLPKNCHSDQALRVSGGRRWKCDLSCSNNDDLSPLPCLHTFWQAIPTFLMNFH